MSDFEGRLKAESERYLTLLERLGAKLTSTLAIDCNSKGTPSRDWARSYSNYDKGVRGMLAEQRERVRLKLIAGKAGQAPLTDDEYETQLRDLAMEQIAQLPEQELRAELQRRGIDPATLVLPEEEET